METVPSPKKKILITGANGFIGGFLVKEALDKGFEVWAAVRRGSNISQLKDPGIHFIRLAYDDPEALRDQLTGFKNTNGRWDYVIHNAGLTKTTDKKKFFEVNTVYTRRLTEALTAAGCQPDRFLLMSSLSSYGEADDKTFRPIQLSDPQTPLTAYGKSKLEAENVLRGQKEIPYTILRPTGVYGPGEKDYFMEIKSVRSGFDFAVGRTPQRITFIYVKDLARVAIEALGNDKARNKEYFVADGDVYTDESFARLIQKLLGKKRVFHARIPLLLVRLACICSEWAGRISGKSMTLNTDKYIILKQRNWICDISPLQDDLNFSPVYNLEKGLAESIDWYKQNGWL